MKDDKNELESLKLLQELLEKGTINEDEFKLHLLYLSMHDLEDD